MIKSVTVINYVGEHIELPLADPYETGMAVTKIEGLGPGSADIITNDNASMDGASFNSSRQSTRNIVITLKLLDIPEKNKKIEDVRHDVYKYFPIQKPLWLIFETDKRSATIQGYVESNEPDMFSDWETEDISIICPNPFFKALDEQETEIDSLGTDIAYLGEVETGVSLVMDISGPIGDEVSIKDETTGEVVTVNTKKITDKYGPFTEGDKIEIRSVKGEKTAIYTEAENAKDHKIFNALDRHHPWVQLLKGTNRFSYTMDEIYKENLKLTVKNDILYEGL